MLFADNHIDTDECIGLGTDGCNALCGEHNSLISAMKEMNTNIVYIKCICHSIQLCSSYALRVLPRAVEYLASQTYVWFSHSTIRQIRYKEVYKTINVREDPLKILKVSDTRLLSIAQCVERVLDQYDELKLHFQLMSNQERCHQAGLLYKEYKNPFNKLYLVFLMPILMELNRVNKLFQLEKASPVTLLKELLNLFKMLRNKIMQPATFPTLKSVLDFDLESPRNFLPISAVCLGVEFNLEADRVVSQMKGNVNDVINPLKQRCKDYIVELFRELKKRLPSNFEQLKSLAQLSPDMILSQRKSQFQDLSFIGLFKGNMFDLQRQWDNVGGVEWPNRYDGTDLEQFRTDVFLYTDAAGERVFYTLATFALSLLALPFSNASVERFFSQMNIIK